MKTLYSKDSKGNLRVWSIYTEGAEVVVKHGQYMGKIQEKRYATEGKNIGKTNETSPAEQAILEAEAKYVKQLKSGYFPDKDDALNFQEFAPMKCHAFNDHSHKLAYPCNAGVKLDGCFGYNTKILTSNGYLPIGYIVDNKLQCKVASFNEMTGGIEFKRVTNWFDNGMKQRKEWLFFNKSQKITKNHNVFSKGEWVRADSIDNLLYGVNPRFQGIVAGMILGDSVAAVEKRHKTTGEFHSWRLSFSVAEQDSAFGETKSQLLDGITWSKVDRVSGYGKPVTIFTSKSLSQSPFDLSIFYDTDRESVNYGKRKEIVDVKKLAEVFTDETFALWYMDDGSLHFNNGNPLTPRIFISVARYSKKTVEDLVDLLKNRYRISPSIGFYGADTRISLSTPDTYYMLARISGMSENMCKRKIPDIFKLGFMEPATMFCDVTSKVGNEYSYGDIDTYYKAYDIEVEDNHNYFAEGVLVHNCRLMIDAEGNAWSKQGEPLELPSHWIGVKEFAISTGGLDGEVYAGLKNVDGLSLQKIISAFRKPNEDTHKLQYWVYDVPIDQQYGLRNRVLKLLAVNKPDWMVIVVGKQINTPEDADDYFQEVTDEGYEGVVYRNYSGLYEFGKRSYNLLKRKKRQTAEATVHSVDIDKNLWGVLNCKTLDGIDFRCQMRVDAGEKNYREYNNAQELIGKVIEVEFEDFSDDGVLQKPVGIGIREVDRYGRPKV